MFCFIISNYIFGQFRINQKICIMPTINYITPLVIEFISKDTFYLTFLIFAPFLLYFIFICIFWYMICKVDIVIFYTTYGDKQRI